MTAPLQAQDDRGFLDVGFPPVDFTVMGKVRQELNSWGEMGKVPCAVWRTVLMNSEEVTRDHFRPGSQGEVTFELEPNTGVCFWIRQIVFEFVVWWVLGIWGKQGNCS